MTNDELWNSVFLISYAGAKRHVNFVFFNVNSSFLFVKPEYL